MNFVLDEISLKSARMFQYKFSDFLTNLLD